MIAAQLIQFLLGMSLLLLSSYLLVKLAVELALAARISPLLVGLTIVALGTSLPEAVVSSLALFRGDPGLAEGNIIGSNISNILLVMPVAIISGHLHIGRFKTQRSTILFLVYSLLFAVLLIVLAPPQLGIALLLCAVLYTWWVFSQQDTLIEHPSHHHPNPPPIKFSRLILLLGSLCGLTISGIMTVSAVETLSVLTGYSTSLFGLSLTAVATSLPELFTTLFSLRSKQDKVTLGNIIGSNIYNMFFIGGLVGFSTSFSKIAPIDWGFLVVSTLILAYVTRAYKGSVVPRSYAAFLLLLWVGFIGTLAWR